MRGGVGERLSFLTGMLSEASGFLGSAEDSPRVRALRAQVRFYEQMVARWAATAPTSAQLQTAFDSVAKLHEDARAYR